MDESTTIIAKTIGSPAGIDDNPWESGHPADGERVAIFAFAVTGVDDRSADIRTYHVTPPDQAREGTVVPEHRSPQGVVTTWLGCGTGTVVEPATHLDIQQAMMDLDSSAKTMFECRVRPDNPDLTR
ncbi:hypothetical protein B7C42_06607 [Nocardia cerradoensis]|uniref:Uncharacterized protein n=1 Tax=Nocardia cerradoensis TaxID=85688 RepID=A0A231GX81_9NOCA|nr:hypothetical protein [Nocardia cerradoensis]OXR41209.1 hypothetical protein B7C42_06607 [Nocardia cerradoensis]